MSEDVIHKLTRFSPMATDLDRDVLLFRAGRASAPSARWWRIAVGILVATQVGTVALWLGFTRPAPPIAAPVQIPAVEALDETVEPPPRNSYLILSRIDPDDPAFPGLADDLGPAIPRPPLTAGWRGPID